ncbi:hypothetical protein MUG78_15090 [Gordonia alkaliphila]|uniref:YncE family protein n=1 Tax=Gordonia alkaliphila TaxID=1053547 RepID=UPI001FF441D4|nr:hypothetical protein [Gordonia alkaliphila]MCK0440742.1 hypothetical protein [Gordonia alkaliphila]
MRLSTRFAAAATALVLAGTLAACGSDEVNVGDGAGDVAKVEPATALASPPETGQPTGLVVPAAAGTALAQSGSTVAVLGDDGVVRLHTAPGAADTPAPREVAAKQVSALIADGDGFLIASPEQLSRVAADGTVTKVADAQGEVLSLGRTDDRILVGTADGHLRVLTRSGELKRDIHDFVRVDEILVAPAAADWGDLVVVLDRAQSLVAPVDIATGSRKAALRSGNGATEGIVDSYGRVLVSNTRDSEIIGFFGQPIVMRFRAPVADGPYALAWDEQQKLLWVSTTGNNAAIAFDLSTGEPRERARIATVGQVSAISVDPSNGMLYLLSARGDGLQAVPRTAVDADR